MALDALEPSGFALLPDLAPDLRDVVRDAWTHAAAHHPGGFASTVLLADVALRRAVHAALLPALSTLAEALPGWRIASCGFASKAARSQAPMPMHQDITMTDEARRPALSLWMPLGDVGPANGCLELVPGSHRLNSAPRAPGAPFVGAAVEDDLRARHLLSLPLPAWRPVVIDQRLFHASGPNPSGADRPAATAVLVPEDQGMRYFHREQGPDGVILEGFEAPWDLLLIHRLGQRPVSWRSLGLSRERAPLDRLDGLPAAPGR